MTYTHWYYSAGVSHAKNAYAYVMNVYWHTMNTFCKLSLNYTYISDSVLLFIFQMIAKMCTELNI